MSGSPAGTDPGAIAGQVRESIAVVLPVYKNRPQLPELYTRLTRVLEDIEADYVLHFVDDAGGDGSREWLRETASRDGRVRVTALERNVGQHAAVLAGLRASDTDLVVVMDADLQDPPEYIPRLLEAQRRTGATVMARRTDQYQSSGRHLTGRLFKAALRRIAGGIPAGTGMYLVIPAVARERVLELAEPRPYLPLLLARTGVPIRPIDIPKNRRSDDSSAYTTLRRLGMGLRALRQALRWRLRSGRAPGGAGNQSPVSPGHVGRAADVRAGRAESGSASSGPLDSAPAEKADNPSRASSQAPSAAEGK